MGKTLEKHTEIERSIIKKFRKTIWNNFIGAVKEYELIAPGDKNSRLYFGRKGLNAACKMRSAAAAPQRNTL